VHTIVRVLVFVEEDEKEQPEGFEPDHDPVPATPKYWPHVLDVADIPADASSAAMKSRIALRFAPPRW
jgi:hypothetical protein